MAATGRKSVCILVVDDHDDSLELVGRVLRRAGHDVLKVTSAAAALAAAREGRCQLVVSDIGMPERDGLSLMRELREQYGLRGIALSGFVAAKDREAAMEAGFDRFIAKPLEIPELRTPSRT